MAELRKEELRRQESNLFSQYVDSEKLDPNDYSSIVNAKIICSPEGGESWAHYADRLQVYVKIAAEKNYKTHIDGPRKAWYTHRNPMGCFMCEDANLIAVMRRVVGYMATKYPDITF